MSVLEDKPKKGRVWVSGNIASVAHPTRQAIIKCLDSGPKNTRELEQELNESRYNLYHHLKNLKDRGIIEEDKDGRSKVYSLAPVKQEDRGGAAQQLDMELEGLTDIQAVMGMGSSAPQKVAQAPKSEEKATSEPSIELEVQGDILNKIIDGVGEKLLSKKKSYKVLIFPDKSKKEK